MADADLSMEDVVELDGRIVMPGDHIADLTSLQVSTVEVHPFPRSSPQPNSRLLPRTPRLAALNYHTLGHESAGLS